MSDSAQTRVPALDKYRLDVAAPRSKVALTPRKPNAMDLKRQSQLALSRWETDGGALAMHRRVTSGHSARPAPASTAVELAQLRIRVIALENLVISLLAQMSDRQLDLAREMATYISPRPGFTHHRPTIHAAAQMVHLVERADHFRDATA
jgi:hypothetical protein